MRTQPLDPFDHLPVEAMQARAEAFASELRRRRTVREFSTAPVPRAVLEPCLLAGASAPNGANLQPWHFVCVSNPAVKHEIRLAAEREEREFYAARATAEWLEDLAPLGTDAEKPFLETAPWLIASPTGHAAPTITCRSPWASRRGSSSRRYITPASRR